MDIINSLKTIRDVCLIHTENNPNCIGCSFYRKVSSPAGLGCIVQTAPCNYDIEYVENNLKQGR